MEGMRLKLRIKKVRETDLAFRNPKPLLNILFLRKKEKKRYLIYVPSSISGAKQTKITKRKSQSLSFQAGMEIDEHGQELVHNFYTAFATRV